MEVSKEKLAVIEDTIATLGKKNELFENAVQQHLQLLNKVSHSIHEENINLLNAQKCEVSKNSIELEALKTQKSEYETNIAAIQKNNVDREKMLYQMEKNKGMITEECLRLDQEMDKIEQKISSSYSAALLSNKRESVLKDLLDNVTNVQWDIPVESSGQSIIKGCVAGKNDFQSFSFDIDKQTPTEITSSGWKLLNEGKNFKSKLQSF